MAPFLGLPKNARKIIQEHKQRPARETCNAILDYALRDDDRSRQIGEPDRIDDKTVFIIKKEEECYICLTSPSSS
jgi:hypothetical protein